MGVLDILFKSGPAIVALSGFVFVNLTALYLRFHCWRHPFCAAAKYQQNLDDTVERLRELVSCRTGNQGADDWLTGKGFVKYQRKKNLELADDAEGNWEERRGVNINNYNKATYLNHQQHIFVGKKNRNYLDISSVEELLDSKSKKIYDGLRPPTPMMNVINHQKRTVEVMSLCKQLFIGFEWSENTVLLAEKSTLFPICLQLTRVHGSPKVPTAITYSEIRDLTEAKDDWRKNLFNVAVLCETPWQALKEDEEVLVKSAGLDLFIFSVKALLLPFALSLTVGGFGGDE
jgi:hypothetical protein